MEEYFRAEEAIDDNMAHAHWILDTQGYKYSHYEILITFPLQQ
jgi:hypothetical protein